MSTGFSLDEVYETLLSGSGGGQGTYDMYISFWLADLNNISCDSFRLHSAMVHADACLPNLIYHPQRITQSAEMPLSNENVPDKIHWMINNNSQTMVGLGTKVGGNSISGLSSSKNPLR